MNWHGYSAIIDTINLHRSRESGIDPDFLSAPDKYLEFVAKIYRKKMNIHGEDFVIPGRTYQIVSFLVGFLVFVTMLSLLCLHVVVVTVSIRETLSSFGGGALNTFLIYSYIAFLTAANLGGVLVFVATGRSFQFIVPDNTPRV